MENKEINEGVIMKALGWAYDKAINGVPGMSTAQDLAIEFLNDQTEGINEEERIYNAANSLIRWQNTKAADPVKQTYAKVCTLSSFTLYPPMCAIAAIILSCI